MSTVRIGTNMFVECETPLAIDEIPALRVESDRRGAVRVSLRINAPPAKYSVVVESNRAVTEGTLSYSHDGLIKSSIWRS